MFGDPLQVQLFAMGITFFTSTLLSLFVMVNNYKDPVSRSFGIAMLFFSIWSLFGFMFHLSGDNWTNARIFKIVSVIFIPLLTSGLNNFAIIFYKSVVPSDPHTFRVAKAISYSFALVVVFILLLDLSRFSGLVVGLNPGNLLPLAPEPGPLIGLLMGHFFIGALFTGYMFFRSRRGTDRGVRMQTNIMLGSVFIGLLAGGLRFATWFDLPISNLSALAAPIFFIGVFYAITRHKLFNIKVIVTEIIIFIIWAFLFFRILLSDSIKAAATDSVLFAIIIVLGIFLIKNVLKEVSQKDELQTLTGKLQTLNERLEEKVQERTEELRVSNIHTEAIIENLTVGLVEYDEGFTVLRVNKAAEDLLGVKRNKIVGKNINAKDVENTELAILARITYPDTKKRIEKSSLSASTTIHEISIESPTRKDLQITTVPFGESKKGGQSGFIKLIRDITREKLIDESKSEFISIAAHQLRTPLSAMKWAISLIIGGETGKVTAAQENLLKRSYETNENMIKIVNDLLNVSKIEDKRFGYDFKEGDIVEVISHSVEAARILTKEKPLEISLKTPSFVKPFPFDAAKISIVMQNLMENAIDYTKGGGSIDVAISIESGYAKVSVKDSGIGIPKDDIGRIFTKFFRSEQAVRTKTDKSGLGLFIVKNIVNQHEGEVSIESEEGEGTKIWFTLPMQARLGETK